MTQQNVLLVTREKRGSFVSRRNFYLSCNRQNRY